MADNDNIIQTAKMNELLKQRDDLLAKIANKYADITVKNKVELEDIQKKIDLEESAQKARLEQIAELEKITNELKEQEKNEKDKNKQKQIHQEYLKKEIELEKLIWKEKEAINDTNKEDKEKHEEYLKSLQGELDKEKQINEQKQKGIDLLKKTEAGLSTITGGLTTNLFNLISINGILSNIGNMFREVVESNEKLAKVTGQVGLMSGDMATGMAQYGVGYSEMAESVGSLYTEMTSFSNVNKGIQTDLAQNAAKMNNLGISTQTTAKNYDLLNKALKFNASELAAINDKIAKSARGAGIAPSKMAGDFAAAMPQLAANGKKAVDVFIQLEKQSKALGIEMNSLLGIVGAGFDTFEGAAEKAGRLNAILGGDYLNSVEMLNATEAERVEIMRKSFEASGKSFETMDRFEQKAVASALGLKDVTEAQKLFGEMSLENKMAMEAEAVGQKKLEESQKQAASSTRQLQLVYNDLLKVIAPAAEIFKKMVNYIAENSTQFAILFTAITALFSIGKIITFLGGIASALSSLGVVAKTAAPAVGSGMGEAVGNFGRSAASAIPTILAFGAAIALIGVGIGVAAYGIGHLAESFGKLNKEQIEGVAMAMGKLMVVLAVAAVAILAAGAAGTLAAGGMLAFGAAVLLVGGGIAVMSVGMAKLVDSVANLNASGSAGNGLKIMKESLMEIIDLISEMPDEVEFTTKLNQLQTMGQVIKTASEAGPALTPAKDFVIAAKDYYMAQKESKDADTDALVQAFKKVIPATQETQTSNRPTNGTPVILKIENGPDLRAYVLGGKTGIF
jgi:hypothetical protein